jgi:hypothetical protein
MMSRSLAGLTLERLFSTMRTWDGHALRYLLCYNGENDGESYDCACCMTCPNDEGYRSCGCICHERIEKMARTGDFPLLISALFTGDQIPKFPSSLDEQLKWRQEALAQGEMHYHNTTGALTNYPQVCCSVCCPIETLPKVLYNSKTGELLRESFNPEQRERDRVRIDASFGLGPVLDESELDPRVPRYSDDSVATDPKTAMPEGWKPGRCA